MVQKTFYLTDDILHLPVSDGGERRYIQILDARDEEKRLAEFYISLESRGSHEYYPLYVKPWGTHDVILRCGDADAPADLFDAVETGGTIEARGDLYPDIYREPGRQQIHFSSRRGWLNDPNGLVYADGTYRMCYQHNPYGNTHGGVNISWGLALSRDGIRFKEYPDAIRPGDTQTHIASGSAIVDTDNLSGKGKGTILAAYTALGSLDYRKNGERALTRGQMLVYSTDGGFSFTPFPHDPVIPVPPGADWRDPKLLRLDDGRLCIAVYEKYDDQKCVSFYVSADCVNWTFVSRSMDLYECPDLFALPAAETGERKWVLYGADGKYRIGDFRGCRFEQTEEGMYLDYGSATYAGQTWNSHPDPEGRYHIAWIRDDTVPVSQPFSQSMSLICRFTLHRTSAGLRLFKKPIDALASLRYEGSLFGQHRTASASAAAEYGIPVPGEAVFTFDAAGPVRLTVDGHGFEWDPQTGRMTFTSGKTYTRAASGPCTVRVISDVRSAELFIDDEISATFTSLGHEKTVRIEGDAPDIDSRIWKLHSIWERMI